MRFIDPFRRAFRWHRRGIAALIAGVAVFAALNVVTSRNPEGIAVVVATRAISGGTTVTADDLGVARVPPSAVPDSAFRDLQDVVGRAVVVDVPARAVLSPGVLLATDRRVPDGRVALPVHFGEGTSVALLHVGDRLDVLGPSTGSTYGVVASDVRVVAIPSSGDGGLLAGSTTPLVLLEVSSAQASAITAAAAVSALSFALR